MWRRLGRRGIFLCSSGVRSDPSCVAVSGIRSIAMYFGMLGSAVGEACGESGVFRQGATTVPCPKWRLVTRVLGTLNPRCCPEWAGPRQGGPGSRGSSRNRSFAGKKDGGGDSTPGLVLTRTATKLEPETGLNPLGKVGPLGVTQARGYAEAAEVRPQIGRRAEEDWILPTGTTITPPSGVNETSAIAGSVNSRSRTNPTMAAICGLMFGKRVGSSCCSRGVVMRWCFQKDRFPSVPRVGRKADQRFWASAKVW